jgi:hypothetical protein
VTVMFWYVAVTQDAESVRNHPLALSNWYRERSPT